MHLIYSRDNVQGILSVGAELEAPPPAPKGGRGDALAVENILLHGIREVVKLRNSLLELLIGIREGPIYTNNPYIRHILAIVG